MFSLKMTDDPIITLNGINAVAGLGNAKAFSNNNAFNLFSRQTMGAELRAMRHLLP
jgi:hypothetical protein